MDGDRRLAGQMVEKEVAQLKVSEINLIANEIKFTVSQKFFTGIPGAFAAGTFFKNRHVSTVSLQRSANSA